MEINDIFGILFCLSRGYSAGVIRKRCVCGHCVMVRDYLVQCSSCMQMQHEMWPERFVALHAERPVGISAMLMNFIWWLEKIFEQVWKVPFKCLVRHLLLAYFVRLFAGVIDLRDHISYADMKRKEDIYITWFCQMINTAKERSRSSRFRSNSSVKTHVPIFIKICW